ncbi:MAG: alpha/beta hydrolase [Paracoccaceae bacterium]
MSAPTATTMTLEWAGLRTTATVAGEGPLVLLLHGFPDTRGTWRHQLPALASAGFRVVAPSLRGYEPTSQPRDRDYGVATLAGDVLAWMDCLGAERARIVGHDWGAAIAWALAARAPDRIERIAALAVPPLQRAARMAAHAPSALLPLWYMAFFQLRGVSEAALLARDGALVRWLWRRWSPGFDAGDPHIRDVIDALGRPGVATAALSYYRAFANLASPATRATARLFAAQTPVPALAIAGARDGCLRADLLQRAVDLRDFPAGIRTLTLPDAGHFLHLEQPAAINEILRDWLALSG